MACLNVTRLGHGEGPLITLIIIIVVNIYKICLKATKLGHGKEPHICDIIVIIAG